VAILTVILIYNFTKDKNDKSLNKLHKFQYNAIKFFINKEFPFNLDPLNIDMLNENIDLIADCISKILLKVLNDSNVNVEKYIADILSNEEREKIQENIRKYNENISRCFLDNQIQSIVYLADKIGSENLDKIEIENIIRYVKTNIKFNKCYLVEETCDISDKEKEILDEYKSTTHITTMGPFTSRSPIPPMTTQGPVTNQIIFDKTGKDYMATILSPTSEKDTDPKNYPRLVINNLITNGGKGSLFYIGKTDNRGLLKKISITGEFSDGSPDSYFILMILPPAGDQHDFIKNNLKDIVINENKVNYWYQFDFSKSHQFLVNFENLSIQLPQNSEIFLYPFGAKTSTTSLTTPNLVIYNPKITLEGNFY
jgi:hypothetical protein